MTQIGDMLNRAMPRQQENQEMHERMASAIGDMLNRADANGNVRPPDPTTENTPTNGEPK